MAKRQVRLRRIDLEEKLPDFSGQKINIVKTDGSVLLIYFDTLGKEQISGRNMRQSKVHLPISAIEEIIIDIPA